MPPPFPCGPALPLVPEVIGAEAAAAAVLGEVREIEVREFLSFQHVVLLDVTQVVSGLLEGLEEVDFVFSRPGVVLTVMVGMGVASAEERAARGHADGGLGEVLAEIDAAGRQAIEGRRLGLPAVAAQTVVPLLVGHNEEDVRLPGPATGAARLAACAGSCAAAAGAALQEVMTRETAASMIAMTANGRNKRRNISLLLIMAPKVGIRPVATELGFHDWPSHRLVQRATY